jgi:hypothetical protein
VSVGGVDAAAAALKRRAQMDGSNKRSRQRTAAKAAAKAAAPSAGEAVDAGVKRKMNEPDPLPSKKPKAKLAIKVNAWLTDNGDRGGAARAAPPRMRTCTRYLGGALAPTKIVMRVGAGRNPPQRYARRRVVRRGPVPAPAEAAPAEAAPAEAVFKFVDPALTMMMGFF